MRERNMNKKEVIETSDDAFFEVLPSVERKEQSSSIFYSNVRKTEVGISDDSSYGVFSLDKRDDSSSGSFLRRQYPSNGTEFSSPYLSNTPLPIYSPGPKECFIVNMINQGTINLVGEVELNKIEENEKIEHPMAVKQEFILSEHQKFRPINRRKKKKAIHEDFSRCESDSEIISERSGLFMEDSIETYVKEQLFIKGKHFKKLKQWIGLSKYKIIFDSYFDDLVTDVFNQRVEGKSNTSMIIVTNNNWVFGCFNKLKIPIINSQEETHGLSDNGFFIFSLNNPHHTMPIKITQKETIPGKLILYPKDSNQLFGVEDAFIISQLPNESYIFRNIEQYYLIPSVVGKELFTGCCYPDCFCADKVFVIEWF
ncbi:hypothetical protein KM1_070220 [Entamoeba histolytica HM-3:IMSS]|uniref:TLDc domain-containing protein n=2 Tax=Entamoeba histolytica TaxID=5759 RepID=M2QH89_ENTHI|nr:Hypothetical protein EHI5A_053770 [Entamoeba histolytica KU27]EMS13421.1 hypothetical protein KM1_070220 [Entamoeba histolytica HM-3:IMSS]